MVAQFLGLKVRLLANAFRRSPWQVFGLILGLLYGLAIAFFGVLALVAARFVGDEELLRNILVVFGGIVVLGFIGLPLVFGVDDTLDPRRFALFGLPNARLSTGLAIAGLLAIPALVLSVCALASIVTWSRDVGTTIVAVICAALIIASCVLASRVTTSLAAFLLATRRSREFSSVIGILLIVIISPLVVLLVNVDWGEDGVAVLRGIADWASWTPLGAAWSVPGDAAMGDWGVAILKLLIALAFLGVLWLAWNALVAKMLVTPEREVRAKAYAGLGWFGRVPGGATGAIAARSLTYWGRDVRYWVTLVIVPIFPAFMVVALLIGGVPGHYIALIPLPIMCLFLGWTIHNDVSYDSTAIWLHITSGTRGISDRVGRIVPVLIIGIPLVVIGSIITVIVYGDWDVFSAVMGVSATILLIGIGLSSFSSAMFPYPASKPGDSPFSQPQSSGSVSAFVQSLSLVAVLVLSAPTIVFGLMGLIVSPDWLVAALFTGLVIGCGILAAGLFAGASVFNRRGPEIMAAATRND